MMTDQPSQTSPADGSDKRIGIVRTLDKKTLERIERIEKVPIGHEECMDKIQELMNRDLPKDKRPGDHFFFYRYDSGKFIISAWQQEKLIKSIIDDRTWHDGKLVPLHP